MYASSLLPIGLFLLSGSPVILASTTVPMKNEVRVTLFSKPNFEFAPPYWYGSHDLTKRLCVNLPREHHGHVESYLVEGGCCTFYEKKDCKKALFSANRKADRKLGPNHRNKIESYQCGKPGCKLRSRR
ncbi:Similar to hypothetical protein CCM_09353 [Cordyceps militaris CM01]; acc. no. EGX87731 [Pyronema omphalodes CBS 100304]|uniref:Uncharacterized protein n=1 Tax=Pyronema omphalodes (strain CBS 100304) TaxID=1076935 RepID=U4LPN4_PYROM|nr:Similar to hypothetical protein CCM_09353 [Cordyceps militaris CM01]; acc. no. EGX87731 [Pyronema omphalodes CBS 100304]